MKKLITIFLIIASLFSFFILFNNEKSDQKNEMELAEQSFKYNYKLLMPNKLSNRYRQEEIYTSIKEALDKCQGNIYYSRVDGKDNRVIKYVYITDYAYFSKFKLESGKFFSTTDIETDSFISSTIKNDSNQIGVIATFGGNDFEIRTLYNMVKRGYLFDGFCTVSFNDDKSIDMFLSIIKKTLNLENVEKISPQVLNIRTSKINILIIFSIYFIVMLLVLYDILKSHKMIGVKKLMGFSAKDIYLSIMFPILKIQIIVMLAVSLVMTILLFKHYNQYLWLFLVKLAQINLAQILALILMCSLPFLYILKVNTSSMLKNKRLTTEVMVLNFFVRNVLFIIFIIAISQGISNFQRVENVFTNSFKQWDGIKDYAVIPSISDISEDYLNSKGFKEIQKNIYLAFNRQGSILANFSEYLPYTRKTRMSETKYDYQRDNVIVNPNYLSKYPVYDEKNNRILIQESEKDYLILVPDKYRSAEKDILTMLQQWKSGYNDNFLKNQAIKIIWTKSNQKLFSMVIDINPNEGNKVQDPLIRVLTESNGSIIDYDTILGIESNPFKIKVRDFQTPSNSIRPILKNFGINKYVKVISSVNEQIASESKYIKEMIWYLLLTVVSIGICLLILILQNIYNYFEKYKQHFVIKHLVGYEMLDKYDTYLLILIANWLIIVTSALLTKKVQLVILLGISSFCILIEVIITLFVLTFISRKNVVKIIKGAE